jgi:hypothetical protein
MTKPDPQEMRNARSARTVALVLAVTMILWMGSQVVGADMGWDPRYAFLFDLAALAAFIWALVVTYQIWRARRREG